MKNKETRLNYEDHNSINNNKNPIIQENSKNE